MSAANHAHTLESQAQPRQLHERPTGYVWGGQGRTVTLLFATRSLSPAAARTSPSVSCTLFILAQFGIKTVGEVNVRCTIYSKVHASIQQLHV